MKTEVAVRLCCEADGCKRRGPVGRDSAKAASRAQHHGWELIRQWQVPGAANPLKPKSFCPDCAPAHRRIAEPPSGTP